MGGYPIGVHPTGGYHIGGHPIGGHPTGGHFIGGHPIGGHPQGGHPISVAHRCAFSFPFFFLTVFLAGKPPNIRSYKVHTYGSGQPYTFASACICRAGVVH